MLDDDRKYVEDENIPLSRMTYDAEHVREGAPTERVSSKMKRKLPEKASGAKKSRNDQSWKIASWLPQNESRQIEWPFWRDAGKDSWSSSPTTDCHPKISASWVPNWPVLNVSSTRMYPRYDNTNRRRLKDVQVVVDKSRLEIHGLAVFRIDSETVTENEAKELAQLKPAYQTGNNDDTPKNYSVCTSPWESWEKTSLAGFIPLVLESVIPNHDWMWGDPNRANHRSLHHKARCLAVSSAQPGDELVVLPEDEYGLILRRTHWKSWQTNEEEYEFIGFARISMFSFLFIENKIERSVPRHRPCVIYPKGIIRMNREMSDICEVNGWYRDLQRQGYKERKWVIV